ncbi:MAG: hypothetical protein O3A01_05725 [bacterium]|nr:hypothetical protein [bacterium]
MISAIILLGLISVVLYLFFKGMNIQHSGIMALALFLVLLVGLTLYIIRAAKSLPDGARLLSSEEIQIYGGPRTINSLEKSQKENSGGEIRDFTDAVNQNAGE